MFLAAFSGALKGQSEITTSYADTKKQLRSSLLQLIALADSDELPAARKIEHTTSVISNKLDNIFRSNTLRMSDIIAGAQKENQQEIDLMMDDVQDALTQLKNYEKNFEAKDPIARQTIRQQILWLLLIGFAANVSMALLLLHYLSASIRKRLMNILENANRLLRRDPMLLPADGTDEIAEIDRTFCKTAERLFSLEQFKDELLSVVSHDLRTPICSLQGYLLMVTNGLVGTLPEALLDEVTATEAEAERLVGFINDLLTAEKMKTSRGDPL
jgi:signal transduction histidine kinase